jgi:N-acetyl sugar amidotransferase
MTTSTFAYPNVAADTSRPYQMCTLCLMDTSDPAITFDDEGRCNHCRNYPLKVTKLGDADARARRLAEFTSSIRSAGRGRPYDCVIGVSGGVDSTYVAYLVKQLGLRPLAVHLDNGWDSELAVSNIQKVLERLDIHLLTRVLDWDVFRELQLSFLRASVSDAEIPTDHAIGATLFETAVAHGIRYVISGANLATEGILPTSWTYGVWDWRYIYGVHRRFSRMSLRGYPHFSLSRMLYFTGVRGVKAVQILNYVPYVKSDVMRILEHDLGWKYYGGKHYESIYTRFFQGYILPRKFNIDKRRAHLSTLICAGQITREHALAEMEEDVYGTANADEDREYVSKKLGLTSDEFDAILALPRRTYRDYPNSEGIYQRLIGIYRRGRDLGIFPKQLGL